MTLALEYVRLDTVVPALKNPKGHDAALIATSIDRFGFLEPILRDGRTDRLIHGHGRLDDLAARYEAARPRPRNVDASDDGMWLLPVVVGWSSANDEEAHAAALALNRAPERGGWEDRPLAELLVELAATPAGLTGTGFDADDLRDLWASSGLAAEKETSFLDDLLGEGTPHDPTKGDGSNVTGFDSVELRVPMTKADRDETVLILRRAQRRLETKTLAETLLALLRAAEPVPA